MIYSRSAPLYPPHPLAFFFPTLHFVCDFWVRNVIHLLCSSVPGILSSFSKTGYLWIWLVSKIMLLPTSQTYVFYFVGKLVRQSTWIFFKVISSQIFVLLFPCSYVVFWHVKKKKKKDLITAIHTLPGLSLCLSKDYRNRSPKSCCQVQFGVLFWLLLPLKPLKMAIWWNKAKQHKMRDLPAQNWSWMRCWRRCNQSLFHSP